jgi:hypothetical protein
MGLDLSEPAVAGRRLDDLMMGALGAGGVFSLGVS